MALISSIYFHKIYCVENVHEIFGLGPTEWGLLIILAVLWGGSFFFVGMGLVFIGLIASEGRLPQRFGREMRCPSEHAETTPKVKNDSD